jgi:hypothetical protein
MVPAGPVALLDADVGGVDSRLGPPPLEHAASVTPTQATAVNLASAVVRIMRQWVSHGRARCPLPAA